MKLERITEQQIRDAIAKLQPDKCQYDYESVANCQRDADQKVVDELEFFIEQLKATNATLIQQTSEYGREYLKAEAKVKALEDAHYELALSTNKIIRELNAQIEALEAKLPTKEEAEEIEIAIVNSDNPPSVDTIVAILAKLKAQSLEAK